MLTEKTDLMRALRPKITPEAAARMFLRHTTGIAVTTATLGLVWWQAYLQVWTDVMFPEGARNGQ